jgi:hypothetical protein
MAMKNHFENNVKHQLDSSVMTLDAMTQSRLSQARYNALQFAQSKRIHLSLWFTGLASAGVIALLMVMLMPASPQIQNSPVVVTATSPEWVLVTDISDVGEIELYQYLDFYQWLEDTDSTGSNS